MSASGLMRVCACHGGLGERVELACVFFLQGLEPGEWILGSFGWRKGVWDGGRCSWKLGGSLQALPFFSSQGSKPRTFGMGGEMKAQSILFINKAN